MRERYETVFKIYDHDHPDADPLASVLMHPAENPGSGGLDRYLEDFFKYDVFKYSGISFDNFMKMPCDWCESVIERSKKRQKLDAEIGEDLKRQLQGK